MSTLSSQRPRLTWPQLLFNVRMGMVTGLFSLGEGQCWKRGVATHEGIGVTQTLAGGVCVGHVPWKLGADGLLSVPRTLLPDEARMSPKLLPLRPCLPFTAHSLGAAWSWLSSPAA